MVRVGISAREESVVLGVSSNLVRGMPAAYDRMGRGAQENGNQSARPTRSFTQCKGISCFLFCGGGFRDRSFSVTGFGSGSVHDIVTAKNRKAFVWLFFRGFDQVDRTTDNVECVSKRTTASCGASWWVRLSWRGTLRLNIICPGCVFVTGCQIRRC